MFQFFVLEITWPNINYRVEDMIKRSFAEIDSARHQVDRQNALDHIKENLRHLCQMEYCPICSQDINHYYNACVTLDIFHTRIQVSAETI